MSAPKHLLILVLLMLFAVSAQASTDAANSKPQEISFQVESSTLVENDEMQAMMAVEDEGNDPSTLARNVNQVMTDALKILKNETAIKSESGNYSTYPVHSKNKIVNWRISQQLRISSNNFAAMNKAIGKLQDKLNLKSVSFGLSEEKKSSAEDSLIQSAIEKFTKRANLIKTSLNIPGYSIKRLDINTQSRHTPVPVMRSMQMEVASAPIATEGGESNVTVSIHAVIDIAP